MLLLLATLTGVLQAVSTIGGVVHCASRLPSSSLKTPRQERATETCSWLLIPRTSISRGSGGFLAVSSPRLDTSRITNKRGGPRLSSGLSKAPIDSLGFVQSPRIDPNALRRHRSPIGAANIPDASTGGTREVTAKNGNISCPQSRREKSSSSTASSDAFGRFTVSPRALRAQPDLQRLAALCRSLAIAAPSCSLYGGLRGVLDYGVAGYALLENLRAALRLHFTSSPLPGVLCGQPGDVQEDKEGDEWEWGEDIREEGEEASSLRDNVFLVETAAIGPAAMWRHSGHLELFHDDVVQCTDTGSLFRIDSLVFRSRTSAAGVKEFEVACAEDIAELATETEQTSSTPGVSVAAATLPDTSATAVTPEGKRVEGEEGGWIPLTKAPLSLYPQLPSPVTGRRGALRPPRAFSLMLPVHLKGGLSNCADERLTSSDSANANAQQERSHKHQKNRGADDVALLRPETAQNIFVAYKGLMPHALRAALPFGLAQEGRAYRNECQGTRSCFLLRLREFRQFEIEYFTSPDADKDALLAQWVEHIKKFFISVGIPPDTLQAEETEKEDLPHYASRCIDFSYMMRSWREDRTIAESPKELCGLALRGNYDLSRHQKASGESLEFGQGLQSHEGTNGNAKAKVLPHVIETSIGIDRLLFAVLHSASSKDDVLGRKRVFLNLHPSLAPYKVAVFPIVASNTEVTALARKVYAHLRKHLFVLWDSTGSLGRRYRKADELGVPFCVSVDDESAPSRNVKVRWRNNGAQIVLPLAKLTGFLKQRCAFSCFDKG